MTIDIRLRGDVSASSTVVLCSCGARWADTRRSVAWTLAAAHALNIHGARKAYVAASKYAREARANERKTRC